MYRGFRRTANPGVSDDYRGEPDLLNINLARRLENGAEVLAADECSRCYHRGYDKCIANPVVTKTPLITGIVPTVVSSYRQCVPLAEARLSLECIFVPGADKALLLRATQGGSGFG